MERIFVMMRLICEWVVIKMMIVASHFRAQLYL